MSSEVPQRTLADYIRELVARLAAAEPESSRRLREVVADRRAAITLDDETVLVAFEDHALRVADLAPDEGRRRANGVGITDRQTVLALLNGYLEVHEAIAIGRLELIGPAEDIVRMGIAIEVLLDGSTRVPGLQALADDFRCDAGRAPFGRGAVAPPSAAEQAGRVEREWDMLTRMSLLPGETEIRRT